MTTMTQAQEETVAGMCLRLICTLSTPNNDEHSEILDAAVSAMRGCLIIARRDQLAACARISAESDKRDAHAMHVLQWGIALVDGDPDVRHVFTRDRAFYGVSDAERISAGISY